MGKEHLTIDSYIEAIEKKLLGESVKELLSVLLVKDTHNFQLLRYHFTDGAVLELEYRLRGSGQPYCGKPKELKLKLMTPPNDNVCGLQEGSVKEFDWQT